MSPKLEHFSGVVDNVGEGHWITEVAIEGAVPAHVLSAALYTRFRSREEHTFGKKAPSAMSLGFGGHVEHRDAPAPEGASIEWHLGEPPRSRRSRERSSLTTRFAAVHGPAEFDNAIERHLLP